MRNELSRLAESPPPSSRLAPSTLNSPFLPRAPPLRRQNPSSLSLLPFDFSSASVRLIVVLSLTWLMFSLTNRFQRERAVHPVQFSSTHLSPGLTDPVVHGHTSALSAALAYRQQSRIAALRAIERVAAGNQGAQSPYPRNLHRIYDGSWEVDDGASLPFADVPFAIPQPHTPSSDSQQRLSKPMLRSLATSRGVLNSSVPAPLIKDKFSFFERKGFALLTAENHPTDWDPFHVVVGELLFRDGAYRTPRDIAVHMVGIYEWEVGRIVSVSDLNGENVDAVLGNLYQALLKHHSFEELQKLISKNVSKDHFVAALHRPLLKLHQSMQITRPIPKLSVPALCPFEAVFNVKKDIFMDKTPNALDLGSPSSIQGGSGVETTLGGNIRYAEVISDGEKLSIRGAQSQLRSDQMSSAQDEMVKMTGSFKSEKCNTKMSLELHTLDTEMLFVKAINYTLLVTVVAFTQVIVLIRQMEMTSTQAGASRVSLMTVGLQAVADSYLCLGHLTLGIAVHTLFNAFATAAFFKFICFSIFLMRWMLLIWKARRPSGFSDGWEAMRRELSMLYSRFYLSLLIGLFLLYQLQDHVRIFVFALYSFWVPQIVLNVVEDHRRPLLPMYIIGTSVTRLAIPLYFWGCPKNFLHIHPLPRTVAGLAGWMGLQALILLSQYKFGPRWFIPKALLPEKYDYYRAITLDDDDDDIEAQNKDGVAGEGDALVANEARRECCICMECVLVHSSDRMVTPCNHFFHAHCLERWLEVRLECALCRRPVPPP